MLALAAMGTDIVAAGEFQTIGGLARRGVARLDGTTGAAVSGFDAGSDATVTTIAVTATTVYVGGPFGQIGGASRSHLAALSATSGAATSWNPGANLDVEQIGLTGTTLVVAGHFTLVAGVERLRLAALDTTATVNPVLSWNPSLDSSADFLHVDAAGVVFAGGPFNYFGAVVRQNVAAIDLLRGELLNWSPGADGWVRALDIHDHTLFIGGDFLSIGGASRHFVAAVDAITGEVASWNPRPDQRVNGLQVLGSTVYFVGDFEHIGVTTARGHGAAVALDGTVQPWDPQADDDVEALFAIGSRVYLGGVFSTVGGATRSRLAAVDATTGAVVTAFDPSVTGTNAAVYRVDVLDGAVFFGGRFSMVDGSTRNNAAAVMHAPGGIDDGTLLGWNPDVSGDIYDLDAFGDDVYLAGGFGAVGGASRPGIAMVDALPSGGTVRGWRPVDVAGGSVSVIDTSDTAVLFGGLLYDLNYLYIGAVLYPEAGLAGVPPQPTRPRARVQGSAVTLDWDVPSLGARPTGYVIEAGTAPGLSNLASGPTGSAATTISGAGLPPGAYYFRLRAANAFGASAATEEQAFVIGGTGCVAPPAPPTDLVAAVNGTAVTLTWRAPASSIVASYRLTAGTTSGGHEVGTFDVGAATTFSTAVPGGAFFVTVRAVNPCGQGPSSGEAVVIVGAPVVPPGAPFGLEATRAGSTVTFTWGAPSVGSGPFAYRLEAGTAPGLRDLADVTLAGPSLVVPGVPPGIYYVRVRAVGAGGIGPAGNEVTLVVP
ncbi:MAG: fibronectin type III domain-containing protein [Vicinamibacterales bacterium]